MEWGNLCSGIKVLLAIKEYIQEQSLRALKYQFKPAFFDLLMVNRIKNQNVAFEYGINQSSIGK